MYSARRRSAKELCLGLFFAKVRFCQKTTPENRPFAHMQYLPFWLHYFSLNLAIAR
jgi:hypothetical protein